MSQPQTVGLGAGISIPSVLISFMASSLPMLQWVAAAVAVISGALSIYSWFRKE